MPNLDQQSTKMLNLIVLQRIDPFIEEILITAAHVTFYQFNIENQKSRKDVEGSLFVVKRLYLGNCMLGLSGCVELRCYSVCSSCGTLPFDDENIPNLFKKIKVQLQQKIKQESEQFRLWKASRDIEVLQLKKEGRRNEYEMHKLLALNQRQKMVA